LEGVSVPDTVLERLLVAVRDTDSVVVKLLDSVSALVGVDVSDRDTNCVSVNDLVTESVCDALQLSESEYVDVDVAKVCVNDVENDNVSDGDKVSDSVSVLLVVADRLRVRDGVGVGVTVLDFESETETVRLSESE
jgi:hypothetical protein